MENLMFGEDLGYWTMCKKMVKGMNPILLKVSLYARLVVTCRFFLIRAGLVAWIGIQPYGKNTNAQN